MIKPQTNPKHFWVVKPQTNVITFNHEKAFRDLGSGFMTTGQRTPVDDNYFKKINSEDKAYFLGLIATDGSLSSDLKNQKRRKLSIHLKAEDVHILKKFKKCLKKNNSL